jgi:3-oxoacyl-[acyl-carrier-protein] synthase III
VSPDAPAWSAGIRSTAIALPQRRVTNADLEARLDTSDEWISDRTGIKERRIAGPGETTATLATAACADALKNAGLTPDDIDLLVVATATPESSLPATAVFVQDALGLRCGAFDLGAACSGFAYSLVMVSGLVANGSVRNALVVGSETLSRIIDQEDRSTAVLFGDAAGAAVVSRARPGHGLIAWDLGSDGASAGILHIPAGGSRRPIDIAAIDAREHFVKMEGREVFKKAVRAVVDSATATLERAGLAPSDIDLFVPHQANARIVSAVVDRLGIDPARAYMNIDRYGNTSAASIPVALAEADAEGRLTEGDLVLLSGFGAGMTWATALLRWGGLDQ